MNRSIRALITSLAVAVCLWPAVAIAQAVDPPVSGRLLTVDQVRDSFARAGFQVQQVDAWDWTAPPVTTVQIRDRGNARVLMALVYPSTAAADAARLQAQAGEQAASANGPHLVPSYGLSVWSGNVALVQTLQGDLDHAYQLQADRDNCVDSVDPNLAREADPPSYAVDLDFRQALSNGV